MNKKKMTIILSVFVCVFLISAGMFLVQPKEGMKNKADKMVTLEQAKEKFAADMEELKDGKYPNLIAKNFIASIEDAEALYSFQIFRNQNFETTIENVGGMLEALEKFFGDTLDKSQLYHNAYLLDENGQVTEDSVEIGYDELINLLKDEDKEQYYFIGGVVLRGDYYAHISPDFSNTWFSKCTLGTSIPGGNTIYNECLYVTGIRQEDAVIELQDGEIQLAELEEKVLDYVNGKDFPLPLHKDISYGIGTVHLISEEEGECVNFVLRRIYRGVPFEYGSDSASGAYRDEVGHDYTTVNYVKGTEADTIMGFIGLQGTIDNKAEITEMITAGTALSLLSERIGENSVYEVYGVELVYRNCEIPSDVETQSKIHDILEPKWKIITINQNDDKYTLFYVDVVTGEITNRFEYYYD